MSDVSTHIQIKLQNAGDFIPKIMALCLREATYPRTRRRKRISILLGEMTQALRSALNYAMWDFAQSNLQSRLSEDEYEKVRYSHDFPIEKDKENFEKSRSRILRHVARDFYDVFRFMERAQPYNDRGQYLWHLKTISNHTMHTIPIEATPIHGNDVSLIGVKPRIVGNQVMIPSRDGSATKIYPSIPCYVEELRMFVSIERKWVVFLIDLGGEARPNLLPFAQIANQRVNQLIAEFYALW